MRLGERLPGRPGGQPSDGGGWDWLWWPTFLGTAASLLVAIAGSLPDSPFKLDAAGSWFFGEPASATPPAPNDAMVLAGFAGFVGMVAMVRIWLYLVRALRNQPGAPLWRLWLLLGCWCAPMLVVAPLFSRDLYSYAAQGEMVARHINPYLYGPGHLGSSPFSGPVDHLWMNAPTPYGPLFLILAGLGDRISGHSLIFSLLLLRLLAVCGVALIAAAVPKIAHRCGQDPALAFAIGAASPLVVFTLVAGGHNDALMAGLLAVGVLCALAGHRVWAIVVIACAAAIKAPAILGVVVLAWTWNGTRTAARVRAAALTGGLALSTGVLGLLSLLAGFGFGWVSNLANNGTVTAWAAPATWLGYGLAEISHLLGLPGSTPNWLTVARLIGICVLGGVCVYLMVRIERFGFVGGLGLMLVAIVLLSPVVQAWYLSWGLVLLACVTGKLARRTCLILASATPFMGLPGGGQLGHAILNAGPLVVVAVVAGIGVMAVVPFGGWAARAPVGAGQIPPS